MKKTNRAFNGVWIPKAVYLDSRMNWTEKILLVEIDSLDNNGGCFATNKYLGEFVGVNPTTVSTAVTKLINLGYITRHYKNGRRYLTSLLKFKKYASEIHEDRVMENQKHNNTSNNTTNNIDCNRNLLYTNCVDLYNSFCIDKSGVGCKMDGVQGKSMKRIIAFLKTQVKAKNPDCTDEDVKMAWHYILNSWDSLDDFHRKQIKLVQIDSNLLNILTQIKNGKKRVSESIEERIRNRMSGNR